MQSGKQASDWCSYLQNDVLVLHCETIFYFTGLRQDGSSYGFLACIGTIYGHKAGIEAAAEELRQMGISDTELPKKHLPSITKLARTVRDMCERDPGMGAPEEKL